MKEMSITKNFTNTNKMTEKRKRTGTLSMHLMHVKTKTHKKKLNRCKIQNTGETDVSFLHKNTVQYIVILGLVFRLLTKK